MILYTYILAYGLLRARSFAFRGSGVTLTLGSVIMALFGVTMAPERLSI